MEEIIKKNGKVYKKTINETEVDTNSILNEIENTKDLIKTIKQKINKFEKAINKLEDEEVLEVLNNKLESEKGEQIYFENKLEQLKEEQQKWQ